MSHVLRDIVDVFLLKEHVKFDVYVDISWTKSELLDSFFTENGHNLDYELLLFNGHSDFPDFIFKSAFMFLKSMKSFLEISNKVDFVRHQNEAIKYFIIIQNVKLTDIKSSLTRYYKPMKLNIFSKSILIYTYFVITESDKISLVSIEWFSPKQCNNIHLKTLNVFNKKSMKWKSKLRNHEKFLNFHGCELTLMVPVGDQKSIALERKMLSREIFQIASKKYKYKCNFQSVISKSKGLLRYGPKDVEFVVENQKITYPNIYFEVIDVKQSNIIIRTSNSIMDLEYTVLITPGELYTPYEKLLLPFDTWTWILVFATYSATFVSIFLINQMPEKIKDVVYGKKVRTPVWNVVGLIFGIGQTRLPDKSFARFILLLFIWFCLIFQVCFQSKMFEFMTSDPRRPSPKTLTDLADQNYEMYALSFEDVIHSGIYREGLKIYVIHPNSFVKIFKTQSQNASAKTALIIDEINLQILSRQRNMDWNRIGYRNMFTSQQLIAFDGHVFHFRMLKKTIDSMIDTGQMENLLERSYNRNLQSFTVAYNGPIVLAMSDLEFGFWIWVGCCCVSIVGFMIEQLCRLVKKTENVELPADRPISNVGTRYRSDEEELEEVDQDESEDINQDHSEEVDQEQTERIVQHETIEVNQRTETSQNQEPQNIDQNIDTRSKPEERNMKVFAEVHQSDKMEESLMYFEAIIDSSERRQSVSHATDSPEAISSFMYIELLREVAESQETIE